MRLIAILIASAVVAAPAFAQKVQSTTSPNAVQIQGKTDINAKQENAVAVGKGNTAANEAGVIGGK